MTLPVPPPYLLEVAGLPSSGTLCVPGIPANACGLHPSSSPHHVSSPSPPEPAVAPTSVPLIWSGDPAVRSVGLKDQLCTKLVGETSSPELCLQILHREMMKQGWKSASDCSMGLSGSSAPVSVPYRGFLKVMPHGTRSKKKQVSSWAVGGHILVDTSLWPGCGGS